MVIRAVVTSNENVASGVFIVTRLITLKALSKVQGVIEEKKRIKIKII